MNVNRILLTTLVVLASMTPCIGQTNGTDNSFAAKIQPFFDRKHLRTGNLEFSRFFIDQDGNPAEGKFQLVFDGEKCFERSTFPSGEKGHSTTDVRIYLESSIIQGSGATWVMRKREAIQPRPGEPSVIPYDPQFVLKDVFFNDGTVPGSTANLLKTEHTGAIWRYSLQSRDKESNAVWEMRESNGVLVPSKFSVSPVTGGIILEYEYEGWTQYKDGSWFPTAMIRRDFQSVRDKLPYTYKYVFHKVEPNIPIHCKWFLPQFPPNASIIDQTLTPILIERPLSSDYNDW